MNIPDFSKFGTNLQWAKVVQEDSKVTVTQRLWLATVALAVMGALIAFFFLISIIKSKDYSLSLEKIFVIVVFILVEVAALAYLLYKEELHLDFGSKYYKLTKGFLWNLKEYQGFFSDIAAIIVREDRMDSGGEGRKGYIVFDIEIGFKKEYPTFSIWRAQTEEQAREISHAIANACGCKVQWEKSWQLKLEDKIKEKFGKFFRKRSR